MSVYVYRLAVASGQTGDGSVCLSHMNLASTEAELAGVSGNTGDRAFAIDTGRWWTRRNSAWEASASSAWPVGSVFISVVATNPNTLLGFGTWSAFGTGRVLVGIDSGDSDFDTVEETGGAKTVTLTEAQIPSHTHVQNSHNHTQDSHNHTQNAHNHNVAPTSATTGSVTVTQAIFAADTSGTVGTGVASANIVAATATNQATTATNQAATAVNQNTGGGGSHSNLQPYIVVHFWKRTA